MRRVRVFNGFFAAVFVFMLVFITSVGGAKAQDELEIDIADVSGEAGELVEIPVYVTTAEDPLAGYEILIVLSRPDLVYFEVDTVVIDYDTSYVCQIDSAGTFVSGWELVEARSVIGKGLEIRLSGMNWLGSGWPPPPPVPNYSSGVLVKFFAHIRDDIPSFEPDSTVYLTIGVAGSHYSNPDGQMIDPVTHVSGSVTVVPPSCDCLAYCDLDGTVGFSPLDVSYIVNHVYKQLDARPEMPACPGNNGDWDCNGAVNPLDVTWYVQYVFKTSGVGPCEPCDCEQYFSDCPVFP